jgi:hypothetical protein
VSPRLDDHYDRVIHALDDGRVVPLLGAGVNRCGVPRTNGWDRQFLPDGPQLARHLAQAASFPEPDKAGDLVRVSQFVSVMLGAGPLYEELRDVFDADYPPTVVHEFLADLPSVLRKRGADGGHQVVVTTNYDDVLERALAVAGEPYDVVSYIADGEHIGKFLHYPNGGPDATLVEVPNEYPVALDDRSVIVKLHGAVDRLDAERDSFVITEDDYIVYLTRTDLSNLPIELAAKLRRCHFVFLGYSLRDWNLRVILHRIWGEQKRKFNSWAVQLDPAELDRKFWDARKVEIVDMDLEDYLRELAERLRA